MKIGIIGQGFVGNAVYQKFKNYFDILTYDIDETKCNSDFHYIKKGCDTIFLCLPTPMAFAILSEPTCFMFNLIFMYFLRFKSFISFTLILVF